MDIINDINELKRLMSMSTRLSVTQYLNQKIMELEEQLSQTPMEAVKPAPKTEARIYKNLTSFAWDQDNSYAKIYATLNNIHELSEDKIVADFGSQSLKILIHDLDNVNYELKFTKLLEPIVPDQCTFKLLKNRLCVSLKKQRNGNWECLSFHQKKPAPTTPKLPKDDDSKDPMGGLMKMMKQMYDDGDDEMKRTIAKAWHEAREKNIAPQFD